MNIIVLTLFPEIIDFVLSKSIIGNAVEAGILNIRTVNIRDYSLDKHHKVDDTLYGGGTGMLMMCQPVFDAWESSMKDLCRGEKSKSDIPKTIYLSPKGRVFNQEMAIDLSKETDLIILCGHYEGIDQRVLDEIVDIEISIGDYVMTGGEIAACAVIDSVARLIPGVLPDEDAYNNESHMNYGLEHPQYTKPSVWHEREVPEVLLSGHHKKIDEWKRIASFYETMQKRPDLLDKLNISEADFLEIIRLRKSR